MVSDDTNALRGALRTRVEASLPIDDLLGWLLREYPDADLETLLSMMRLVHEEGFQVGPADTAHRTYLVCGRELEAPPQRVQAS